MKLLLIEDEATLGAYISSRLEQQGFICQWVRTGSEGLEAGQLDEFDCIILDRLLPDIEGLEICRALREDGQSTPLIMLTALSGVDQKLEGFDAGADDYLTKPFAIDELIARVNALIRRASNRSQPEIQIRGLILNPANRCLVIDSQTVALSNREFLLLEYLMRNAGKALTRYQILDHVWETHAEVESNLVDVYINYLRRKIDLDPDSSSNIETMRGYGYRFRVD